MRKSIVTVTLFFAALTAAIPTPVSAGVIPPIGLAPGSPYQLIFVTLETTSATSADINYYNSIVTDDAAFGTANFGLPAGLTWRAVASTPTEDARDNAPSGGLPVYNTQGQLVATSSIYGGSLLAPVYYNESGFAYGLSNAAVWTGSDTSGVGLPGETLGFPGQTAEVGFAGSAGASWMADSHVLQQNDWALYALSSPTTVPVPEPATLILLGSALLLLCGFRALSLRRRAT